MLQIVFPSNENLSYISKVNATFEDSRYLIVLDITGQNITGVDMIENPNYYSKDKLLQTCLDKKFKVLIIPENDNLNTEKFKEKGINIYKAKNKKKKVLNIFSDYVQDKLIRV